MDGNRIPEYTAWNTFSRLYSKLRYYSIYNSNWKAAGKPEMSVPVESVWRTYITQVFGVNPEDYSPLKGHDGVDWGVPVGTPILAPIDMTIFDLLLLKSGYGRHVVAIDGMGNKHIFGHLNKFLCGKKDFIKRGQIFALSGGNLDDPYHGYSSGAHLHYELRPVWESIINGYAGAVDPMPYFTLPAFTSGLQPSENPAPVTASPVYSVKILQTVRIRKSPKVSVLNDTNKRLYPSDNPVPIYGEILEGRLWGKTSPVEELYVCLNENGTPYSEEVKS